MSGKERKRWWKKVHKATGGKGADATINVSDYNSAAATSAAVTKMHGISAKLAQISSKANSLQGYLFKLLSHQMCQSHLLS